MQIRRPSVERVSEPLQGGGFSLPSLPHIPLNPRPPTCKKTRKNTSNLQKLAFYSNPNTVLQRLTLGHLPTHVIRVATLIAFGAWSRM